MALPNCILSTHGGQLTSAGNAGPTCTLDDESSGSTASRIMQISDHVKMGVSTHLDIPYLNDGNPRHKLDLFVPASPPGGGAQQLNKCIVFIHGGGWKRFDRRNPLSHMHSNVGLAFATRGFVTAVVSYRLSRILPLDKLLMWCGIGAIAGASVLGTWYRNGHGVSSAGDIAAVVCSFLVPPFLCLAYHFAVLRGRTGAVWPDHVQDGAAAVAWLHQHAAEYGGDPNNIAVMGHSAGGHIATMLCVDAKWLAECGVPHSAITACVGLSGVYSSRLLELTDISAPSVLDLAAAAVIEEAGKSSHRLLPSSSAESAPALLEGGQLPLAETLLKPELASSNGHVPASPARTGLFWYSCLFWPITLTRRLWFLRPAFGTDSAQWPSMFPTGLCWDAPSVIRMALPPMLLVNARYDVGLNAHTDLFQAQLLRAENVRRLLCKTTAVAGNVAGSVSTDDVSLAISAASQTAASPRHATDDEAERFQHPIVVERYTLEGSNHVDYIMGMNQPGWRGDTVAVPMIVSFLNRFMR